jgi:pilus assembly protein CpaE
MMPLTAAFVISNRTVWEQAHACIQNLPVRLAVEDGIGQSDSADTDALLDRIERHRVDVVLVEAGRIGLPLEEFVRRIRNTAAQSAVFVLNQDASPELILEALRAGANEYLYPPLSDTLRDALQRLSAARSKGGSDTSNALGKVFGFFSARGGCGATTVAVHVASAIARHAATRQTGPRPLVSNSADQTKQTTLLADLDFEAGLLRFLMKSKATYSVRDAIDNMRRMDASLWKGLVSSHADGLDLISAPDEVAVKRSPGREEMMHLMRFIRSAYPVSIADFGRNISVAALDSLPELEALYLVTTPDLTSLEHAKRAIRNVEGRGFGGNRLAGNRLKVLLNRAGDRGKTNLDEAGKFLGRPCEAVIRNDHMALYDAYSEGRFVSPASPVGKDLQALSDSIRDRVSGERDRGEKAATAPPAGGKRWLSFLQKAPSLRKTQEQGVQA